MVRLPHDFDVRRSCPACGSEDRRLALASGVDDACVADKIRSAFSGYETWNHFFDFYLCADCDLLFSACYPNEDLLAELYRDVETNEVGQDGPALDATHTWLAQQVVAPKLGNGRNDLRVLELGPDTGRFASALSDCAPVATVDFVEPNVTAWEDLRSRFGGDVVVKSSLSDLGPRHPYDAVIAHHVFDHVPDLRGLMNFLNALTARGSTLSVVVHSHRSILRRIMRSKWPPFCLQHPHLFSRRSLARLLKSYGWDVQVVRRQINYVGVIATFNNFVGVLGGKRRDVPQRDLVIPIRFGNICVVARRESE